MAITPLNGQNYGTWKVQSKLALLDEVAVAKFNVGQDKALAISGLSIDPTLLYLLDDIYDPKAAWKKLHDQYCKKTWANKLELRNPLPEIK